MVADANTAIKWLRKHIHANTKIIVWGHGLGSAVVSRIGINSKDVARKTNTANNVSAKQEGSLKFGIL